MSMCTIPDCLISPNSLQVNSEESNPRYEASTAAVHWFKRAKTKIGLGIKQPKENQDSSLLGRQSF